MCSVAEQHSMKSMAKHGGSMDAEVSVDHQRVEKRATRLPFETLDPSKATMAQVCETLHAITGYLLDRSKARPPPESVKARERKPGALDDRVVGSSEQTGEPLTSRQRQDNVYLCLKSVQRWGLSFDEDEDEEPEEFLESAREWRASHVRLADEMLSLMPCILKGSSRKWYRTVSKSIRTWTDFEKEFRIEYCRDHNDLDLYDELSRRYQGSGEKITSFVRALRQISGYFQVPLEEAKLADLAFSRLRREYRQSMSKETLNSLEDIVKFGRRYERQLELDEAYLPPVSKEKARIPSAAFDRGNHIRSQRDSAKVTLRRGSECKSKSSESDSSESEGSSTSETEVVDAQMGEIRRVESGEESTESEGSESESSDSEGGSVSDSEAVAAQIPEGVAESHPSESDGSYASIPEENALQKENDSYAEVAGISVMMLAQDRRGDQSARVFKPRSGCSRHQLSFNLEREREREKAAPTISAEKRTTAAKRRMRRQRARIKAIEAAKVLSKPFLTSHRVAVIEEHEAPLKGKEPIPNLNETGSSERTARERTPRFSAPAPLSQGHILVEAIKSLHWLPKGLRERAIDLLLQREELVWMQAWQAFLWSWLHRNNGGDTELDLGRESRTAGESAWSEKTLNPRRIQGLERAL